MTETKQSITLFGKKALDVYIEAIETLVLNSTIDYRDIDSLFDTGKTLLTSSEMNKFLNHAEKLLLKKLIK